LWKVVLTKTFLLQFLNLVRDKQDYVLDSIKFLKDVLNLDTQPEFDFVDEYDDGKSISIQRKINKTHEGMSIKGAYYDYEDHFEGKDNYFHATVVRIDK